MPLSSDAMFCVQLGTAANRFSYGPLKENLDLALLERLPQTESRGLEFRMEDFNNPHHAEFFYGAAAVNGKISSPSFGEIVSADAPRLIQLAAKFYF